MKKPISGKWILYYDEETLLLKEEFIVNPNVKLSEEQKNKLPKNRIYKCNNWKNFCECKCTLKRLCDEQKPKNLQPVKTN